VADFDGFCCRVPLILTKIAAGMGGFRASTAERALGLRPAFTPTFDH